MYWVGAGLVKIKVRHSDKEQNIATLHEGEHFGEISLLYECKRSATVTSTNYQTLAYISAPRLREVISEFPEFET